MPESRVHGSRDLNNCGILGNENRGRDGSEHCAKGKQEVCCILYTQRNPEVVIYVSRLQSSALMFRCSCNITISSLSKPAFPTVWLLRFEDLAVKNVDVDYEGSRQKLLP